MDWIVATPEGNKPVSVDPANIEAFTGGGLTTERVVRRLNPMSDHAVAAYLAALHASEYPVGDIIALYSSGRKHGWPTWWAALDPRPNQEETPDGSGGIRLVEIPEAVRVERFGPAPAPVEWWSAKEPPLPEGDVVVPWQDPATVPLTDAGHAKRIREALAAACEHIDAALRSGLTVEVSAVLIETTFPAKNSPAVHKARFHAEIARPL
jgi:hypothetical protein